VSDIVSNLYKISQVYICGQPTIVNPWFNALEIIM